MMTFDQRIEYLESYIQRIQKHREYISNIIGSHPKKYASDPVPSRALILKLDVELWNSSKMLTKLKLIKQTGYFDQINYDFIC